MATASLTFRTFGRPLWACTIVGALSTGAIADDELRGQDEPSLRAAVVGWLADDDESLETLSALAHKGNRAARLLLGRIEITDRAPQPGLRSLSKDAWVDLFRAPRRGSRFAPSWIKYEAKQGNSFAATLEAATTLGLNPEGVHTLIAAGEAEAAEHLIRKIATDGSNSMRDALLTELPPDHELKPYLFGFRHAHAGINTGTTAFQRITGNPVISFAAQGSNAAMQRVDHTYSDHGYQGGDQFPHGWLETTTAHSIADWVLTNPTTVPLARLCNKSCGEAEIQACATLAFGLFGGYYEVIRLDSPLENLISQSDFLASTRARNMTARRIANARTEIGDRVFTETQLRERSACLADAVQPWRMPDSFD